VSARGYHRPRTAQDARPNREVIAPLARFILIVLVMGFIAGYSLDLMKQKLRDLIKAGREKEESDLLPHVNDAPSGRPERWTAKDQLAHLTAWRQVAVAEMDAVRTEAPGPDVAEDENVENAKRRSPGADQPPSSRLELRSTSRRTKRSGDRGG
jgi:hypothetical protein